MRKPNRSLLCSLTSFFILEKVVLVVHIIRYTISVVHFRLSGRWLGEGCFWTLLTFHSLVKTPNRLFFDIQKMRNIILFYISYRLMAHCSYSLFNLRFHINSVKKYLLFIVNTKTRLLYFCLFSKLTS